MDCFVLQLADFDAISLTAAYTLIKAVRSGESTIRGLDEKAAQDLGLHNSTVSRALTGSPVSETGRRSRNVFDYLAQSLNKKISLERDYPRDSRQSTMIAGPLLKKYLFPYLLERLFEDPKTARPAADFFKTLIQGWPSLEKEE